MLQAQCTGQLEQLGHIEMKAGQQAADIEACNRARAELQQKYDAMQQDALHAREELQARAAELRTASSEFKHLQQQHEIKLNEVDAAKKIIQTRDDLIQTRDIELKRFSTEINTSNTQLGELHRELQETKKALLANQTKFGVCQTEVCYSGLLCCCSWENLITVGCQVLWLCFAAADGEFCCFGCREVSCRG